MTTVFDLAVVGGGILGCLAGDEAARRHPGWNVLLLDRHGLAAGATGWSLAADIPFAVSQAHHNLIGESKQQWSRLEGSGAARLVRKLPIVYVVSRDRLPALQDQLGERRLREVRAAELEPVRRMLPGVRIHENEIVVTHDEPGALLPPRDFVNELLRSGPMAANTRLRTGQSIVTIRGGDPCYELIGQGGDIWRSQRVILATGPWPLPELPKVSEPFAPSVIKRVAALKAILPIKGGDPIVFFPEDDLFILPDASGTAMISFDRHCWEQDPAQLDGALSEEDLHVGLAALAARSTVSASRVIGGQAFCDRYTESRLPYVWNCVDSPGLAAILAGSGSGVRLAPGLAARAVSAVDR